MFLSENLQEKWGPVLDHPDLPQIKDSYRKAVTAVLLENEEKAIQEEGDLHFYLRLVLRTLSVPVWVLLLEILKVTTQYLFPWFAEVCLS